MINIGIIIGSTRPGRNCEAVSKWVYEISKERKDAKFELVDILDYNLPLLDEPYPPAMMKYTKDHTKKWANKISEFDGFIFVTPEYNHSTSGALKNAIDYLNNEWNNKAVGFVSYGGSGGVRAVEHLRAIVGTVKMAPVSDQVSLSLFEDFQDMTNFHPHPRHQKSLETLFNQVIEWSKALKPLRQ